MGHALEPQPLSDLTWALCLRWLAYYRSALVLMSQNQAMAQLSETSGIICLLFPLRASLVAQMVKNLPAIQETQVQSLGGEDPLE